MPEIKVSRISIAITALWLMAQCGVQGRQIVVSPETTDELLANPSIGWETFNRTRQQDKNLPAWIPSTINYSRWDWRQLEPEPGKLNTNRVSGLD